MQLPNWYDFRAPDGGIFIPNDIVYLFVIEVKKNVLLSEQQVSTVEVAWVSELRELDVKLICAIY